MQINNILSNVIAANTLETKTDFTVTVKKFYPAWQHDVVSVGDDWTNDSWTHACSDNIFITAPFHHGGFPKGSELRFKLIEGQSYKISATDSKISEMTWFADRSITQPNQFFVH